MSLAPIEEFHPDRDPRHWSERATCRDRLERGLPDLHGAPATDRVAARDARRICVAGCPVMRQCEAWAVDSGFRWSGVTVAGVTFPYVPDGRRHPGLDAALAQARRDKRQAVRLVGQVRP